MTHSPRTRNATSETAHGLRDVPRPLWAGIAIGVIAFFVEISSSSITRENGVVTQCMYVDYAGFIAAAAIVVCAVLTVLTCVRRGLTPRVLPLAWIGIPVILALGVVHVLRGAGIFGGIC